uniref:Mobile element protein n=1 Tax=Escherichia coli TaxID=562 RepID=A0A075M8X0_ECOLX|nr:Mobile element protein [Escherichia coli]UMW91957.1 Mobile element protein [Escherichia coli]UMW93920.1 Mobile element protein [Escherichia coli]
MENKRVVKKDSDNTCMADFNNNLNNNLYAIINLLRSP